MWDVLWDEMQWERVIEEMGWWAARGPRALIRILFLDNRGTVVSLTAKNVQMWYIRPWSPTGISSRKCMFLFLSFSWKHTYSHYKPPPDIHWTPKLVHWPRTFLWWHVIALVTKSIARWVLSVCRHILLLAPDLHTINVPWWWMNNSSLNDSLEYLEGNGGAIWCGKWEYVIAPLIHGIYSNPVRGGKCLSWLRGNVCDWLFFGSNQFIMLTEEIGHWEITQEREYHPFLRAGVRMLS